MPSSCIKHCTDAYSCGCSAPSANKRGGPQQVPSGSHTTSDTVTHAHHPLPPGPAATKAQHLALPTVPSLSLSLHHTSAAPAQPSTMAFALKSAASKAAVARPVRGAKVCLHCFKKSSKLFQLHAARLHGHATEIPARHTLPRPQRATWPLPCSLCPSMRCTSIFYRCPPWCPAPPSSGMAPTAPSSWVRPAEAWSPACAHAFFADRVGSVDCICDLSSACAARPASGCKSFIVGSSGCRRGGYTSAPAGPLTRSLAAAPPALRFTHLCLQAPSARATPPPT